MCEYHQNSSSDLINQASFGTETLADHTRCAKQASARFSAKLEEIAVLKIYRHCLEHDTSLKLEDAHQDVDRLALQIDLPLTEAGFRPITRDEACRHSKLKTRGAPEHSAEYGRRSVCQAGHSKHF